MPKDPINVELLRAIAAALPEPIFVLDEDGRYVAILGGAFRQKYDDPNSLVGRRLHDVLQADRVEEFMGQVRIALEEDRTVLHDYTLASDDVDDPDAVGGPEGKQYFEGSVVPLGVEHEGRRLVAWIAYNATERHRLLHRLEQQHELLQKQQLQLERLAMTDELTGLANRRRFMAHLEREFRDRRPLSLILLDVDHFKHINDTHGHPAGDIVLRRIGRLLGDRSRRTDMAGRVGGEEFAVLLPDVELAPALGVAEEIRQAVRSTPMAVDSEKELRCTISAGVASVLTTDTDHSELLRRADAALYEAKRAGRDRTCLQSEVGAVSR